MKYNRRARLDTSEVRDTRRGGRLSGGSGVAVGGGGLGADANTKLDCAVVADIDSIQSYW